MTDQALRAELQARIRASCAPPPQDDEEPTRELPIQSELALDAGRCLGPYRIERVLGRGAMGCVYLARHTESGLEVALKCLLRSDLPQEVLRFEREADALRRVQHPNVVRVYESGSSEEIRYLACEYVRGTDLDQLLAESPHGTLLAQEALPVALGLARALRACHAAGVVHRDVKPANVMLTAEGEVRLVDLGIALSADVSSRITAQGTVLGTLAYLDPKVFAGEPWSPAADAYALGSLLYRVLSGRLPLPVRSLGVYLAALERPVPSLVSLCPRAPELSRLADELISLDPSQRPGLPEVVERLERLERTAERAPQSRPPVRTPRPPRAGAPDSAEFRARSRIGPYLVGETLGQGSNGPVYRARHAESGQACALKILEAREADPLALERFQREARALRALDHPGVVRLQDSGATPGGRPYLALDLVEGETLAQALQGGLPFERALDLLEEVCLALGHCHRQGLVHRDLKPENLMIEAGRARIVDFGLAKLLGLRSASLTETGELLGTPSYMSPEQVNPDLGKVSPASDVFALGCVIYELLRGRPPYAAETILQTLSALHTAQPYPALEEGEGSPELRACVARCLAIDPAERWADGLELYRALAEARRGLHPGRRPRTALVPWSLSAVLGVALGAALLAPGSSPAAPVQTPAPSPVALAAQPEPSPDPTPTPSLPAPAREISPAELAPGELAWARPAGEERYALGVWVGAPEAALVFLDGSPPRTLSALEGGGALLRDLFGPGASAMMNEGPVHLVRRSGWACLVEFGDGVRIWLLLSQLTWSVEDTSGAPPPAPPSPPRTYLEQEGLLRPVEKVFMADTGWSHTLDLVGGKSWWTEDVNLQAPPSGPTWSLLSPDGKGRASVKVLERRGAAWLVELPGEERRWVASTRLAAELGD